VSRGQRVPADDPLGAADAVQIGLAGVEILHPPVDRQHVGPRPAAVTEISPVVEVGSGATYVDQPVQRARSTQDPAAGPMQRSPAGVGLGDGVVGAVLLCQPQLVKPGRVVDGGVAVSPSCLHRQHLDVTPDRRAAARRRGRLSPRRRRSRRGRSRVSPPQPPEGDRLAAGVAAPEMAINVPHAWTLRLRSPGGKPIYHMRLLLGLAR
jgi:hypothetical protein